MQEQRNFRVEAAPEGICPECVKRLGTGLATYERDWGHTWRSRPDWHTEVRVESTIRLLAPCRLAVQVRGEERHRPVIWRPADELVVRPHVEGLSLWRTPAPEGGEPPAEGLRHVVVTNTSRERSGEDRTALCVLSSYQLDATPAEALLQRLRAEYDAEAAAEADAKVEAEAKRRAADGARWRERVRSEAAGHGMESAAALLAARQGVAAQVAHRGYGGGAFVGVPVSDAIRLALAGTETHGLAAALFADEYVSKADDSDPDRLVEPVVCLKLRRVAPVVEGDGAVLLSMRWPVHEGAPVAEIAPVVAALITAGMAREAITEDASLAKVGASGLRDVVLEVIDRGPPAVPEATGTAITPNGTVLKAG